MKTTQDAVNEFKGVWPYPLSSSMVYCTGGYLKYKKGGYGNYLRVDFSHLDKRYWTPVCTKEEFEQCASDLSNTIIQKPIYTQAIKDAGELPSVGMECMVQDQAYNNVYYNSVILFVGVSNIMYLHGGTEYSQNITLLTFKPIEQPIELIDGKAYQFEVNADVINGIYRSMNDSFYNSFGDERAIDCTNIKLLEVK